MSKKQYCITFAGPVGSSKTPIANYLSWNLGIPLFSHDTIRAEVSEDLLVFDQAEYEKRRDERGRQLITSHKSFIYDASVDRQWLRLHEWLVQDDYEWFIISLDLSKQLLNKLYDAKGYSEGDRLDALLEQHQAFLDLHGEQIGLHITDESFSNRLGHSLKAVTEWLNFGRKSRIK